MTKCNFDPETNILTCVFSGRMDGPASEDGNRMIREELKEVGKREAADTDQAPALAGLKIVFDLKGVDYVSSVFFRICIAMSREVKKGNFSVSNTSPFVKKIFKMAGLEEILNVS